MCGCGLAACMMIQVPFFTDFSDYYVKDPTTYSFYTIMALTSIMNFHLSVSVMTCHLIKRAFVPLIDNRLL